MIEKPIMFRAIVSLRQNGVGPSKTCVDAILPKGHDGRTVVLGGFKGVTHKKCPWRKAKGIFCAGRILSYLYR